MLIFSSCSKNAEHTRVFIFTDINIDSGDPDDRQSLVHLFWYANELEIEGIVPERWNAKSYEACELALAAYENDYTKFEFHRKGYPPPKHILGKIAKNDSHAKELFMEAASIGKGPLYVLVWGNMLSIKSILEKHSELAGNIRLITIGTNLMLERDNEHIPQNWERAAEPCLQYNWNGFGRNEIYNDERFNNIWWLEINWTYNGMFTGEEPRVMFNNLSKFGELGFHIKEVVKNEDWAQYFRVGDTPSVLYVIDKSHNLDDPTMSSWAGRFTRPFPNKRPNYFTDSSGKIDWDYADPCNTWDNHMRVFNYSKSTLEERRDEMYEALIQKLIKIYN